jgi:serine/threonine protein kinase
MRCSCLSPVRDLVAAPEIILGEGYDFKVDVWSLGLSLIELADERHPYDGQDAFRVRRRSVLVAFADMRCSGYVSHQFGAIASACTSISELGNAESECEIA